jgi:hypothetical protein
MSARHNDWWQVREVRHIAKAKHAHRSRLAVVDELACSGDTVNQIPRVAAECDRRALERDVDCRELFRLASAG